jgi:hypothetical protein
VTDGYTLDWPWTQRWQELPRWNGTAVFALPLKQPAVIPPDDQPGIRSVVMRHSALTCGDAQLIVIGTEQHRCYQWPAGVRLLVDAKENYAPDPRTLRLNPSFSARPLSGKPMRKALEIINGLCGESGVERVAVGVKLGFEDEGPELKFWRNQQGLPSKLTFYYELSGDVESFGPYVDGIE